MSIAGFSTICRHAPVVSALAAASVSGAKVPARASAPQAVSIKAVASVQVSATHPRVWLDAGRLATLRRLAARNTARWQRVRAVADAALASTELAAADLPRMGSDFE